MIVNHSKTRLVPRFPYCVCWQDDVIQSVRQGRILWMTSSCQETEKGNRKHLHQNDVQICPVSCQSVGVRASVRTKSTKSELSINKGLAHQGLKNVLLRYHWWMSGKCLDIWQNKLDWISSWFWWYIPENYFNVLHLVRIYIRPNWKYHNDHLCACIVWSYKIR